MKKKSRAARRLERARQLLLRLPPVERPRARPWPLNDSTRAWYRGLIEEFRREGRSGPVVDACERALAIDEEARRAV